MVSTVCDIGNFCNVKLWYRLLPIMSYKKVLETIKKIHTKYNIVTNTFTFSGLLGLGDFMTQCLERKTHQHSDQKRGLIASTDWARTGRMLTIGVIMAPVFHTWYRVLDKYVVGSGTKTVFKKIAADQILAAPLLYAAFFFGSGMLEGKGVVGSIQEIKDKLLIVYLVDLCVWPGAQFINFNYLPTEYRVVYVSCVTLGWNMFLSFMKHREGQPTLKEEHSS